MSILKDSGVYELTKYMLLSRNMATAAPGASFKDELGCIHNSPV